MPRIGQQPLSYGADVDAAVTRAHEQSHVRRRRVKGRRAGQQQPYLDWAESTLLPALRAALG